MQTDRLTQKTLAALQSAQGIPFEHSHQELDGEHLLLALMQQEDGLVKPLLQRLGVNLHSLHTDLNKALSRRSKVTGTSSSDVFLSSKIKKTLDTAGAEASKLKDDYVSTEHLLLGLIESGGAVLEPLLKAQSITRATAQSGDLIFEQTAGNPSPLQGATPSLNPAP